MSDTGPVSQPIARRPDLTDEVYERIKARLMDNTIAPGARLGIDALARDLQVSATPVREALARLESDGLVTRQQAKGYRATQLMTREQFVDLFEFRMLVEPWAAERAAERASSDGVARLRAELDSAAPPRGNDYAAYHAFVGHDDRFHDLLAELSGSDQVRAARQRTHSHLHIFRLYFETGIGPEALGEHQRIVDAVAAGDGVGARQAMSDHISAAMTQRLLKVYDQD